MKHAPARRVAPFVGDEYVTRLDNSGFWIVVLFVPVVRHAEQER